MPIIKIDAFVVNGIANGHVKLPCDGTTTVPMVLSLSTWLLPGEGAAIVPVWIGSQFLFAWSTMVRDVMLFNPPPGQWQTITRNYSIGCSAGCRLTPSGPVTGQYTPDGASIDLKAAFYDSSRAWGFKWWFSPNRVKVSCEKRLRQPAGEWAEGLSQDSPADEQLAALARKIKRGDRLRVEEDGRIVIDKRRGADKA